MNGRIRELAEQATILKFDGTGSDMSKRVLDQEKFAELIVQECVAVCWAEDGPESGTDAGWYLKEHFEVDK